MPELKIKLNDYLINEELYYVRMILFGFSKIQISNFFDSDQHYLKLLKDSIEFKFETSNWSKITLYIIHNSLINIKDYRSELLSSKCLEFISHKIVKYFEVENEEVNNYFMLKKDIEGLFKRIDVAYKIRYFYQKSNLKLNKSEVKILKLKYLGANDKSVARKLDISTVELQLLVLNMFKKLRLYSWFAVFRFAFQVDLLKKDKSKVDIMIEELTKSIHKLIKSDVSLSDKRILIYEHLLKEITVMEFDAVFERNHKNIFASF